MACCNKRRAQLAPAPRRTIPSPQPRPQPEAPAQPIALRFTGARRVRVEGVVSGRIYRASPAAPLLSARPEDVRSLLRSGLFVRA